MRKKLPLFLSVVSGLLLSLPWLFHGMGWVLFFAFVPLLLTEFPGTTFSSLDNHHHFLFPFLSFLVWNVLTTWWIGYVSVSGMILIVLLNALLMAGIWWMVNQIHSKFQELTALFSLIVFWLSFEFLQHHWSIPWPWLTLGNGLANSVKLIQWYEFTGVLGGSLWILISNILFFLMVKSLAEKLFLRSFKWLGSLIILIIIPFFWSLFLYSNYSEKRPFLNVLILQPNINPYTEKFSGLSPEDQLSKLMALAETNVTDSTNLILSPETALPTLWEDSLQTGNQTVKVISKLTRQFPKMCFISGALTQRKFKPGEVLSETARQSADRSYYFDIFNSALMFDSSNNIQICHKNILVNGVERRPFQKYFSFLGKLNLDLGGTSGSLASAREPAVFSGIEKTRIGPLICFESAFGEYSGKLVSLGANLLVVITNDGWWKDSPGTSQHFDFLRVRAIENRRSIVQSANTGISGVINQRGDVLKESEVNLSEAFSSRVQLNDKISFYVRYGDYIGRICMLLSGLIIFSYLMIQRRRQSFK